MLLPSSLAMVSRHRHAASTSLERRSFSCGAIALPTSLASLPALCGDAAIPAARSGVRWVLSTARRCCHMASSFLHSGISSILIAPLMVLGTSIDRLHGGLVASAKMERRCAGASRCAAGRSALSRSALCGLGGAGVFGRLGVVGTSGESSKPLTTSASRWSLNQHVGVSPAAGPTAR